MIQEDFAPKLIEKAKSYGATAAEVVIGDSAELSVTSRNGKLEEIERAESSGFGLRVFVDHRSAVISSSNFNEVESLAERALAMARIAPSDEFSGLAPAKLLYKGDLDLEVFDTSEPSEQTLIELALEVESQALAVKGITNSEGGNANFVTYNTRLVTSEGFDHMYKSSRASISVSVIAGNGTGMQRDYDYSTARFLSDLETPEKIGKSAAKRVLAKLNPRKVPSSKFPVVYDKRIARNLLADLANGINGGAIARGTSFLKNKLGEQVFPATVNIIDDPHIKRGQASKPFDGEGVVTKELKLIENGILKNWLLDLRSATQLKRVTNGHASRSSANPPSPAPTNLYMENGSVSFKDLLANIKTGFYVTETFGMGINYTNGDYSQGASGIWIENGELTYPVSEITLAGNLLEMFRNLTAADDLEMKYNINAPTLCLETMTIAGK